MSHHQGVDFGESYVICMCRVNKMNIEELPIVLFFSFVLLTMYVLYVDKVMERICILFSLYENEDF